MSKYQVKGNSWTKDGESVSAKSVAADLNSVNNSYEAFKGALRKNNWAQRALGFFAGIGLISVIASLSNAFGWSLEGFLGGIWNIIKFIAMTGFWLVGFLIGIAIIIGFVAGVWWLIKKLFKKPDSSSPAA